MIVAFDLGSVCGWARLKQEVLAYGNFKLNYKDPLDLRYAQCLVNMREIVGEQENPRVFYEKVQGNHRNKLAAYRFGAYEALLHVATLERNGTSTGIGSGTLKKLTTGNGRCGKDPMIDSAMLVVGKHTGSYPRIKLTDDEADAICLLDLAHRGLV